MLDDGCWMMGVGKWDTNKHELNELTQIFNLLNVG